MVAEEIRSIATRETWCNFKRLQGITKTSKYQEEFINDSIKSFEQRN